MGAGTAGGLPLPSGSENLPPVPRRVDRAVTRALHDEQLDATEATELLEHVKHDDVLSLAERAQLTTLLERQGDRFEPEAQRLVKTFLDGGRPLSAGPLPDPNLSWDTADSVELRTPPGAALYVDGVHHDDVVQNELGDCFLLASLSALAAVRPAAIEAALTDHGDGTYTVRFFEKQGRGRLRPVEIRVDADLPTRSTGELVYAQGRAPGELWPALIEKAWATWKGGYGELALGGYARDALTALTGAPVDFYNPMRALESRDLWQLLTEAHAEGRAMVIGTGEAPREGLVPMHLYAVVGVREEAGEKRVTLRNPYGQGEPTVDGRDDGVFELTLRELRQHFEDLYLLRSG